MAENTLSRCVVPFKNVSFESGFWHARRETNRTATLPAISYQTRKTGRFDAWKLDWKPGQPNKPHYFWDSDAAKWIEAAAYNLVTHPDQDLENQVDSVIDLIAQAQQPDGYLNIVFTVISPEQRWRNLRERHELYCAGHLIEAAVAYYQATGKRKLLDVICRYADHIDSMFGPDEGKKRGYPGHQEIELALVRLYHATGEKRYLNLAKFFIDERGQQPHYYDLEMRERGESWEDYWAQTYRYTQSHIPVREQTEPVGHAVRACYMYAGMADVALETDDESLAQALRTLWDRLTERQMYITGGIGPSHLNEGFTFDYDLPNDTAYAETCASVALVFWAHRMFHLDGDSRYIDVMERALYNGVLSGVALDGQSFFYANPLETSPHTNSCDPRVSLIDPNYEHYQRSEWFSCACCPPNLARLISSIGQYFYSTEASKLYVHLFGQNEARIDLDGGAVNIAQHTAYPWEGKVHITVTPDKPHHFTVAVRIPVWCQQANIQVNGQDIEVVRDRGYAIIERDWIPGDQVELILSMPIQRIRSHPKVRQNIGCIALQRGPLIYCVEQIDNGPDLGHIVLPSNSELSAEFDPALLGGITVISGKATRLETAEWSKGLYQPANANLQAGLFTFKAIPYCFWSNREPGEMRVWIRES